MRGLELTAHAPSPAWAPASPSVITLAAGIWHNHLTGQPACSLAAYGRS